jgi:hypothetical protein
MRKELRAFLRVKAIAPLFARSRTGLPDLGNLSTQGFDEFLKRSLTKRIDISSAGLSFESDVPFAPGDFLDLRIMLEDVYEGSIDFCVEVLRIDVYQKHYRIAVKYLDMEDTVRDVIRQFVALRESQLARSAKKVV